MLGVARRGVGSGLRSVRAIAGAWRFRGGELRVAGGLSGGGDCWEAKGRFVGGGIWAAGGLTGGGDVALWGVRNSSMMGSKQLRGVVYVESCENSLVSRATSSRFPSLHVITNGLLWRMQEGDVHSQEV